MDEATATQIAQQARAGYDVPASYAFCSAQRRIIELTQDASADGPLVRDVDVWIVRFQSGVAWAELAVDEATTGVVRVQRSRSQ